MQLPLQCGDAVAPAPQRRSAAQLSSLSSAGRCASGLLGEVTAAGGQLIAVSPQRLTSAQSPTEKHELAFPFLSDGDQTAIRAYRLRYELPAALKDVYANAFGVDLSVQNADGSWTLTVPATYVVDQQHRIRFAFANTDWRIRAEPADVLAALRDAANSR